LLLARLGGIRVVESMVVVVVAVAVAVAGTTVVGVGVREGT